MDGHRSYFAALAAGGRIQCIVAAVRADPGEQAHLLWSYVDLRDAAEACVLAATVPFEGHHPLFITAADTASEAPTNALMERSFPGVPLRYQGEMAHWSVLEGSRAAAVLGFQPRYEWRAVLGQQARAGSET